MLNWSLKSFYYLIYLFSSLKETQLIFYSWTYDLFCTQVCLTLNRTLTSVSETVQHCKADHGVDIPELVQKHSRFYKPSTLHCAEQYLMFLNIWFNFSVGLDDYGYIKMINYLRTTVSIHLNYMVQVYICDEMTGRLTNLCVFCRNVLQRVCYWLQMVHCYGKVMNIWNQLYQMTHYCR